MIHRDVRRSHARKPDPKPEPAPIEPDDLRAVCLVGGCDWSVHVTLGHDATRDVERHRREKHPWVKTGRLHRIEVA